MLGIGTGERSPGRWTAALGGPRTPGSAARKRSAATGGGAGAERGTGCGSGIPGGSGGRVPGPGGGRCCGVRGCSAAAHGCGPGAGCGPVTGCGPVAGPGRWAPEAVAPVRRRASRMSRAPGVRPAGWVRTATRSVRRERSVSAADGRLPAGPSAVAAGPAGERAGSPVPAATGAPPATARTARSSAARNCRAAAVRPRCAGASGRLPGGALPGGGPGSVVTRIGRAGPVRPRRGGARS